MPFFFRTKRIAEERGCGCSSGSLFVYLTDEVGCWLIQYYYSRVLTPQGRDGTRPCFLVDNKLPSCRCRGNGLALLSFHNKVGRHAWVTTVSSCWWSLVAADWTSAPVRRLGRWSLIKVLSADDSQGELSVSWSWRRHVWPSSSDLSDKTTL